MEVIDLHNPNWAALEDPYVLLGCKAIFDPDTGPELESCTQDFERCYRCCASCRADCLQHFETNPETLGVYHAAYLAYLHPAQAVEDHARPCEACAPGSFKRTQADEACSTCLTDHFCPAASVEVEGQPWVPVGSTVGPRFLAGIRGSPQKIRQLWVLVALW